MTMPDRIPSIIAGMEDLATEIRHLRTTSDRQETMAHRQRVVMTLLAILTIIILATAAWFFVEAAWPSTPLIFKTLTVQSGQHVAGPLNYNTAYCRYNSGTATVARNLLGVGPNPYNYPFAPVSSVARNGCGAANIDLPLPPGVKPGVYVLTDQASFTVHTFPYRVVTVRVTSNRFTLVP